jgi:hypothetical protein
MTTRSLHNINIMLQKLCVCAGKEIWSWPCGGVICGAALGRWGRGRRSEGAVRVHVCLRSSYLTSICVASDESYICWESSNYIEVKAHHHLHLTTDQDVRDDRQGTWVLILQVVMMMITNSSKFWEAFFDSNLCVSVVSSCHEIHGSWFVVVFEVCCSRFLLQRSSCTHLAANYIFLASEPKETSGLYVQARTNDTGLTVLQPWLTKMLK